MWSITRVLHLRLRYSCRWFDTVAPKWSRWTHASGYLGEQERAAWWAQMISAVYARITVAGLGFVGAQLSPIAERHGLALALPEQVRPEWRARPGSDPRFSVRRERVVRIPIAGRDEWKRAARQSA